MYARLLFICCLGLLIGVVSLPRNGIFGDSLERAAIGFVFGLALGGAVEFLLQRSTRAKRVEDMPQVAAGAGLDGCSSDPKRRQPERSAGQLGRDAGQQPSQASSMKR